MGVPNQAERGPSKEVDKDEHPEIYEGLTRVQHMVERGEITEVPEAFIQPHHMRASTRSLATSLQIPVIDMAVLTRDEEGRKQVKADITRACEEWGFFRVINHGVPASLMDAMMAFAKRFFAMSPQEKEVYKHQAASGAVGYGRIFEEYRKPDEVKEWLDRLTLDLMSARDPSQSWLVVNNPLASKMYNEYGEAVCELHKKLLAMISEELGQATDFLYSKLGHEQSFMRTMFNYYPPCPQPELVMGSAPHADACALTILQQEVPGLQVLHDGVWVPALTSSSDHAFVVNIGDSLQIISNGRFKSALHRAVVQHDASRISIPNFLAPGVDIPMQPAAELCNERNPPLYRAVTLTDFLKFVIAEGYGRSESRAVEHFRV